MVRASLKRSRSIGIVLLLSHLAAAATLVPLEIPALAKGGLALMVAANLIRSVCRHALLRTPRSVLAIEIKDQRTAAIRDQRGEWRDARILGSTYVTPALTVLNLEVAGERLRRHVLLVPDNIEPEDFRRVRVLLRWSRTPST